jgi:glycine dehydrogenase subunit 2
MKTLYNDMIFERSTKGRIGFHLETDKTITKAFPKDLLRDDDLYLPEVSELETMRHFVNISTKNFGIETTFYPLGSCTMKYNPKLNDELSSLEGFTKIHPTQPDESMQGLLHIYDDAQHMLSTITGMGRFSLHPFAGAHGEQTGLMIIKKYHEVKGNTHKDIIIVPDNAHGTNPASAIVCGFKVREIKSNPDGTVNLDILKAAITDDVAGLMLTNPNTAGVFEKDIVEISKLIHDIDGLVYYDGANLNALVGTARPGDMGFDVMHINLHKTFSTPHGGGGPGSGPVGVTEALIPYLPNPLISLENGTYKRINQEHSIGHIGSFVGNVSVYLRAYVYMMSLGKSNLLELGKMAVLNANYVKASLSQYFNVPQSDYCMHEFVFDGLKDNHDIKTLDIAKRLLDYGIHAPTIYFPLIYKQALMIEPTEAESKIMLDHFINVMTKIVHEAHESPDLLKNAPHQTDVRRLDEASAARQPILNYRQYVESLKK